MSSYSLGVDFGTNSVRALLVDTSDGTEIGTAVRDYSSGHRGILESPHDPLLARQNPRDYLDGLQHCVAECVRNARSTPGFSPDRIVGIGIDTTGSTPIPVDSTGQPLAFQERFRNDLAAQAWLWKDHTAFVEAEEITQVARQRGEPYLAKCGGTYSSEWYWSKILHCLRSAPHVAEAAASWVELSDFIPGWLTGNMNPATLPRSICAAGHKAMYHPAWGGLPSADFLSSLQPGLERFRYETTACCADQCAGRLQNVIAMSLGLPAGVHVAYGAFDAHLGAVGAGCRWGTLVKILGTSTCDCLVAPLSQELPDIPGLCGIVPESILPGMYGLEAGQSAVGDIFHWFANLVFCGTANPEQNHRLLTDQASQLKPGESGLLALDWNNGNRTILVDPLLTGVLIGQTLHSTPAEMYRAWIEATGFGGLMIIRRLEDYGVRVDEIVACGGIAEKSPLVMQIYADICNRPFKLSRSAQTCALGAAIMGAVVGGAHPSVEAAQRCMTGTKEFDYRPDAQCAGIYARLFPLYEALHDQFGLGRSELTLAFCMKELLRIRDEVRRDRTTAKG
jgi:L-ribulokinase